MAKPEKRSIRVAAAVLFHDGKLLIARRASGDDHSGRWELPGGTIEADERPEEAICREMREELSLAVRIGSRYANSVHEYEHLRVDLDCFLCTPDLPITSIAVNPDVHSEIRFVPPPRLADYRFTEADIPIIKKIIEEFS